MSLSWLAALIAIGVLLGIFLLRSTRPWSRPLRRAIEARLGGYRQPVNHPDPNAPTNCNSKEKSSHTASTRVNLKSTWEDSGGGRVAVLGGGLAGIGVAATLGGRGIPVTLYERNPYLGGKIGAWKVAVGDGEQTVEHGFHAFFRQYYNLNRFLDGLGLRQSFREIEDYLIFDGQGRPLSFGEVETVPALNILDLGRRGFYRWRDLMPKRTRGRLEAFLRFDMEKTYEAFDGITFGKFCDDAAVPEDLRIAFRTFARAFFADGAVLSTADVLRAFHFYYLSHDHGLMYDYPAADYESALLSPIRAHLEANRVDVRLGTAVDGIAIGEQKRYLISDEEYDWVVIAADIPGMQAIVERSPWIGEAQPELAKNLQALRTSHGYAVWRIWVDRDVRPGLPTFINVDRRRLLDSLTLYHRITDEARTWVSENGGAVLELHSYALPEGLEQEEEVRRLFLEELAYYFPELTGLEIKAEVLQVRHDFPAFAPGQHALRPAPELPIEGLLMAGDWVRLPYPMAHMEAAFTSGLVCANAVLSTLGLREEPIFSVAPKGLLPAKQAA
jgi:isorenieratene synthase